MLFKMLVNVICTERQVQFIKISPALTKALGAVKLLTQRKSLQAKKMIFLGYYFPVAHLPIEAKLFCCY